MTVIERVERWLAAQPVWETHGRFLAFVPDPAEIKAMREVLALAKVGFAVWNKRRKPNPNFSDFPTYPNPFHDGVVAEWVHGRGWVSMSAAPKRKRTKKADPVFAAVDAKADLDITAPRPLMTEVLARRERKARR